MSRRFELVRYEVAGNGVARVAMDDPERRNALSDAMVGELIAAIEAAGGDPAARVVVIASTHPRTFSAGGSLDGFATDRPLVHKHSSIALFPDLFALIGQLGKPVICEVDGHCLAGALGLALACDLVLASESATFATPEIDVGLFPFMIAALIYRNVPRKKAIQLMLLGDRLGAAAAERAGIVNEVVPQGQLRATADRWAGRLAAKSPLMMRLGKQALWRQQDMPLQDAWDFLRAQLTIAFSTEDLQEGVAAFFEKREPVWRGC